MNPIKRQRWLFDLLLHTEETFTSRTNFFLVAEAMFLVALAATVENGPSGFQFLFELGGLIFSFIWLRLGRRTYDNLGKLADEVNNIFPEYAAWRKACKKKYPANLIIGKRLPILVIIIWVLALFLSLVRFFQPFQSSDKVDQAPFTLTHL